MKFSQNIQNKWSRFWMRLAGSGKLGKIAASLSAWGIPPYYGRVPLSRLNRKGYISLRATLHHQKLKMGAHVYIDDGVTIFQDNGGETVELGDSVQLHRNTIIQTGAEGRLTIGEKSHIQPRCQFSAYKGPIVIGRCAEIAPGCAFYSYNHGTCPDQPVRTQPISTKGGIFLGDDVWLGYGVIVLDGVHIGKGAVIGAGSVVTSSIPDQGIAAGNPARLIKIRKD